ncbi:TraK family protein [Variovorax sp. CAN2819]|uniref:TraK family protein n=1 Tax=Variovorax sp. CAN15 TaxID=3046727 RepID=UPI00264A3143|nr:TraK family protein [Variovorax sp. CAN15]MDN6888239.1 TraK family protein [Variovorax sp. CAN15]
MASKYTDELAAWVRRQDANGRGRNLVAFLAVKPDVSAALAEGYSVKTIWTHMNATKRIEFGYETFLSYVHKQLKPARGKTAASTRDSVPSTQIQRSLSIDDARAKAKQPSGEHAPAAAIRPHVAPSMPAFSFTPISPSR